MRVILGSDKGYFPIFSELRVTNRTGIDCETAAALVFGSYLSIPHGLVGLLFKLLTVGMKLFAAMLFEDVLH